MIQISSISIFVCGNGLSENILIYIIRIASRIWSPIKYLHCRECGRHYRLYWAIIECGNWRSAKMSTDIIMGFLINHCQATKVFSIKSNRCLLRYTEVIGQSSTLHYMSHKIVGGLGQLKERSPDNKIFHWTLFLPRQVVCVERHLFIMFPLLKS